MTSNEAVLLPELREGRLTRPDGRVVAWTEWGEATDAPMLRVPGTPGCRYTVRADVSPWAERELRMVTTERPGFGASSRLEGRGFAEHADDLAAILDELGIERLPVIGGSGAAPHILACVSRPPDRVTAATILVGAAPLDNDEVGQMIGLNQTAHHLIRAGDVDGLRALLAEMRESFRADPLGGFRTVMAEAPPADQEVMNDPAWQAAFERAVVEALRPGVDGWADESMAITLPWNDIDVERAVCSITWWHGDGDRNAPLSAAQRLIARLPNARLELWKDGGHFTGHHLEPQILDELLERSAAASRDRRS